MQDAGIMFVFLSKFVFDKMSRRVYTHTKPEYNSSMHSLRLRELKEEVTELAWRQNFQNDVCKGTLENPDDFSLHG